MREAREVAELFAALVLLPLAPALALSWAGAPWEAVAVAAGWAAVWYGWLKMRTDGRDGG